MGFVESALLKVPRRLGGGVSRLVRAEVSRVLGEESYSDFAPSLIHGDLHSAHVLVADRTLGIIDWGDSGMGNPETDFLPLYQEFGG